MTEKLFCKLGDGKPAYARGWCSLHYMRWYTHGDPLTTLIMLGDDRARFEAKVDRSGGPDACHPWLAARGRGGYGYFWVNGRMRSAHIVGWLFENEAVPGTELDHECHNSAVRAGRCTSGICEHRACCNPRHLVPRSRQNHVRSTEPFNRVHGAANGRAKLTIEDVRGVRAALTNGEGPAAIARRYGMAQSTIRAIRDGRSWAKDQ